MKKIYVLDTSVLMYDSQSLYAYGKNDIALPLKVLDELDLHKDKQTGPGICARTTIRNLDSLRNKGSLHDGVSLGKGKGKLTVVGYDPFSLPEGLEVSVPDNEIIGSALTLRTKNQDKTIVVVSKDINMRVKCDAIGLACEDYDSFSVAKDTSELYTGHRELTVEESVIDSIYSTGEAQVKTLAEETLYPNEFIMLKMEGNEKKTALVRHEVGGNVSLLKQDSYSLTYLKALNREQKYALNLLLDPDVPVVTLGGQAGCGKTLIALAAGLEQVCNRKEYSKLIVSRSTIPMGRDIGFLPGEASSKLEPWIAPIKDNLEFLQQKNKGLENMFDTGRIVVEALTYMRGRSISNVYMIIDEAQNLTVHELKTVATRIGFGTKLVLCADAQQIDNMYLNSFNNGFTYAVEKFKPYSLAGHVQLLKGERSEVATLSAKIL